MSEGTSEVMSGRALILHLFKLLNDGAEGWNSWRRENPQVKLDFSGERFEGILAANLCDVDFSHAKFIGSNFRSANLRGANFRDSELWDAYLNGANLHQADFSGATLIRANLAGTEGAILSGACLSGADLSHSIIKGDLPGLDISAAKCDSAKFMEANLRRANASGATFNRTLFARVSLVGANLMGTNFSLAEFHDVDVTGATIGETVFAGNDLSNIKGLDAVDHRRPSTIGIDTIYRSNGNLPEMFLKGCGVPDDFIVYMRSLTAQPIEFYSCFISYSSKDQLFSDRLFADLQAKGVRTWYFPEDAKWGEPVWKEIDSSIKVYDKLVVICSKQSLQSGPVLREIERSLDREDKEGKSILFPVRLDDFIFDGWQHERKDDLLRKVIGDFSKWKTPEDYQTSFDRLLRDLKA